MSAVMPDSHIPVKHDMPKELWIGRAEAINARSMQNLKSIRQGRKLSQQQLADMVGANQATISKIENGDDGVTLRMINQIAKALNVTPFALFSVPDLQSRAMVALERIDPDTRPAALTVLEAMARASQKASPR